MQQSGLVSILFPLFLFSCFSGKRGPIRKGNRQFRGGISWFSSLILGVTVIYSRTFQQGKLHVHHIHHHHCHHGIISHPRLSLVAQQRNPSLLLPAHRPFWVMVESGDFTLSLAVLWIHPRQNSVLVDHGYYPLQKGRFESNSLSTKSKNKQKSIWSCYCFLFLGEGSNILRRTFALLVPSFGNLVLIWSSDSRHAHHSTATRTTVRTTATRATATAAVRTYNELRSDQVDVRNRSRKSTKHTNEG